MKIKDLREKYHSDLFDKIIRVENKGIPNFADTSSRLSCSISEKLIKKLNKPVSSGKIAGQTKGKIFADVTKDYLSTSFEILNHIRPGKWLFSVSQAEAGIAMYDQYEHLAILDELIHKQKELLPFLGHDYLITPDLIIGREPISDYEINQFQNIIEPADNVATLTSLRERNLKISKPILHASISCKWTIRSDRSQNTRTEALNLIRNRKGKTPQIAVVIAEPLPTRINSLAMGTGDVDCVYHFALYELLETLEDLNEESQLDAIRILINGKRLRDVSDLSFDLVS